MKILLRISLCLFIILFGSAAIRHIYGPSFLDLAYVFSFLPFILLLIISTVVAFALDTTFYRLRRNMLQYTVSFIGLLFCSIIAFRIIRNKWIETSNTLFVIKGQGITDNATEFEMKENNYFKLTTYSTSEQVVYYGSYKKTNDILKITSSNYNDKDKPLPQWGIIRDDTMFWSGWDTMLIDHQTH